MQNLTEIITYAWQEAVMEMPSVVLKFVIVVW